MSENEKPWEQDLQHLGERIREDLDLLHPVTEKRFQAVYEVVSQQWHKEQARLKAGGKPRALLKKQEQSKEKQQSQTEAQEEQRLNTH
jgi:hypothetical protein